MAGAGTFVDRTPGTGKDGYRKLTIKAAGDSGFVVDSYFYSKSRI